MPNNYPDILTLLVMFLVSVASGVVGILNKISQGNPYSLVWVTSEFIAALLCGYLAYDAYPGLVHLLPGWVGMPIFVAACSHAGGKLLQIGNNLLTIYASKLGGGGK